VIVTNSDLLSSFKLSFVGGGVLDGPPNIALQQCDFYKITGASRTPPPTVKVYKQVEKLGSVAVIDFILGQGYNMISLKLR
jgi:hypothetical protein